MGDMHETKSTPFLVQEALGAIQKEFGPTFSTPSAFTICEWWYSFVDSQYKYFPCDGRGNSARDKFLDAFIVDGELAWLFYFERKRYYCEHCRIEGISF